MATLKNDRRCSRWNPDDAIAVAGDLRQRGGERGFIWRCRRRNLRHEHARGGARKDWQEFDGVGLAGELRAHACQRRARDVRGVGHLGSGTALVNMRAPPKERAVWGGRLFAVGSFDGLSYVRA